jgi:hypothetical protein
VRRRRVRRPSLDRPSAAPRRTGGHRAGSAVHGGTAWGGGRYLLDTFAQTQAFADWVANDCFPVTGATSDLAALSPNSPPLPARKP